MQLFFQQKSPYIAIKARCSNNYVITNLNPSESQFHDFNK